MFKCQRKKLWVEYLPNITCSLDIIPLGNMTLAEQMNALSRMVIIISVLLLFINTQLSLLFLLLSLLFIIILYYIQKSKMENFTKEHYKKITPELFTDNHFNNITYNNPTSKRFCNDELSLDNNVFNNPNWISQNQRLAGKPNPKTNIAPVIVPPSNDLSYWKATNNVIHSAINQENNIDVYHSGYQISTCCAPMYDCNLAIPKVVDQSMYNYDKDIIEDFNHGNTDPTDRIKPNLSGQVNVSCGYNPEQLFRAGLPTNMPVGNCMKSPAMKQYNENLFTQTIQPGIYTRNEINEPINSNIGISFTQQFPPTTCNTNPLTGDINFIEHDPRIIEPHLSQQHNMNNYPTESNIYDPRFSGYGTSYRTYTDNLTGQPKFYYDDVDAIRMPNYLVRSNIDNQPFADQYGPLPPNQEKGNFLNADIHALADDAFLQGCLQQRTELSERLMRKVNNEQWQRRMAPIRTSGQKMLGGLSCRA